MSWAISLTVFSFLYKLGDLFDKKNELNSKIWVISWHMSQGNQ